MSRLALLIAGLSLAGLSAAHAQTMTLTSPDIEEGATIANEQVFKGCTGGNVSPALSWSGAPKAAKSFVVTVYDPDAPTGSGWWHWVAYNIPAGTASLPKGAGDPAKKLMPEGTIQSRTDFGAPGYGGPCPPAWRQAAPLYLYGFRGERGQAAGRQGRSGFGSTRRLRPAFPYTGQSNAYRLLRTLKTSPAWPHEPGRAGSPGGFQSPAPVKQ